MARKLAASPPPPKHSMSHSHEKAVERIATSVRGFYDRKEAFRIYHGSMNSTRQPAVRDNDCVDTSLLFHVLSVNPKDRTALVEPNVAMDRLVEATLKYDLIPPVVMEFPGITVGGDYAGTSGESSSFRRGFFNRTINRVKMVLANGNVVECSDSENADPFHGAAGAVGSLDSDRTQEVTVDPKIDHFDDILFSPSEGAVITGRMTGISMEETGGATITRFGDAKDPWFYLHVKDVISNNRRDSTTELIPFADYLFWYDRGGFWVGAMAFDYCKMPFNNFMRRFLDEFLHTRMMYTALHASGISKKCIIQDLALPYSTAGQFVEYAERVLGIWPLWLYPLRQSPALSMHPPPEDHRTKGSGFGANAQHRPLRLGPFLTRRVR